MDNIKNFSNIELTEYQKRVLCLGQGFAVSKSFNLGNFLLYWNKFKNKIRWRLFFLNKDNSSPIHPYRKSSGQPAPVGSGFESKLMENVFSSCEKEFLSKEFKVTAAKFKSNVTFLEKLGTKGLISNPDVTIFMQDNSKQLVVKSVQSALSDLLTTSATHGTFSRPITKRGLILIGLELDTNARQSLEHC